MGRPRKQPPKAGKVLEMTPDPVGGVAVAEAEAAPPPQTPFDPPQTEATARPQPAATRHERSKAGFFQKVAAIAKEDWGTRAYIYVYCYEPICNLKAGGENKYLVRLSQPVLDEQFLMVDYGSGIYNLKLVKRKPENSDNEMLDQLTVEIYNPKYPPKIPPTVWMNDPRNERWRALLPKEEPPAPPTPLGTITQAFETFTNMQDKMQARLNPAPAASPAIPVTQNPASDPIDTGLRIAQMFMQMKTDNPMVDVLKEQMKAMGEAQEKAREREAALQHELRELILARSKGGEAEKKSGIKELIGELKEVLPAVKDLFPQAAEAVRGGRTNGWDILREVAPDVAKGLFGFITVLANRMPAQAPPPAAPLGQLPAAPPHPSPSATGAPPPAGQQPQQQPAPGPPQNVPKFVVFLSQPIAFQGFMRYFEQYKKEEASGSDFAQWVFDGAGAEPLKEARAMGSANIMQLLKQSPAWMMLATDEGKLGEFIDQALAWAPPEDEGDGGADDAADDDEANVDLTKKGI